MIELVVFSQQGAAQFFATILETENIPHQVTAEQGGWRVDILNAEDYHRARALFDVFQQNPFDARFQKAAWQSGSRAVGSGVRRGAAGWWQHLGPVTRAVLVTCLVFFAGILFGGNSFVSKMLFPDSLALLKEQPWRMITPIFLHFGALHLIFNLLWWQELAGVIERYQSSLQLLLLMLATAIIPNYAQFAATGSNFGGLSGVVYGLLGYLWIYGRVNPGAGYAMRRSIVLLMLGWLIICFIFFSDSVANQAHLYGLIVGSVLGGLSGLVRRMAP